MKGPVHRADQRRQGGMGRQLDQLGVLLRWNTVAGGIVIPEKCAEDSDRLRPQPWGGVVLPGRLRAGPYGVCAGAHRQVGFDLIRSQGALRRPSFRRLSMDKISTQSRRRQHRIVAR